MKIKHINHLFVASWCIIETVARLQAHSITPVIARSFFNDEAIPQDGAIRIPWGLPRRAEKAHLAMTGVAWERGALYSRDVQLTVYSPHDIPRRFAPPPSKGD